MSPFLYFFYYFNVFNGWPKIKIKMIKDKANQIKTMKKKKYIPEWTINSFSYYLIIFIL